METGKIKWFNQAKGFGFIERQKGKDIFIHISNWIPGNSRPPHEGDEVTFTVGPGQKGPEAKAVQLAHTPKVSGKQKPVPSPPKRSLPTDEYRFLNPYNFVRFLDKPRPKNDVLGNCPPPPHDRYIGLTGRITCEVEAVSSLFVSDSHGIEPHPTEDKHKIYRFFTYPNENGELEPALPASSLRGMVRSVFEAATNSCFSVFKEDEFPLEHRQSRAPDMYPARVVQIKPAVKLELLDCTLNTPNIRSGPTLIRTGAVIEAYPPRVKNTRTEKEFDPKKSRLPANATEVKRVAALVNTQPKVHCSSRFRSFIVEQVVPIAQHPSLQPGSQQQKVFGWLYVTGPNIENKHDERLFFRWDDKHPDPKLLNQIPEPYLLSCEGEVVGEYNHHLAEYWNRHQQSVEKLGKNRWPNGMRDLPQPSLFVEKGRELQEGDLVYIQRDNRGKVTLIRSVSMPRIPYHYKRQEFLPRHLDYCCDYDCLCPACRTFGWVADKKAEEPQAYAGRVRFTHGKLTHNAGTLHDTTLAILSSPKPTTTLFYLLDQNGTPANVTYDSQNAQLRGRKVYRHHSGQLKDEEYTRAPNKDQNRTVRGALEAGAKFTFTLDFENLTEEELGALLWALELEEGMHHRLGYAKPLGFGSIKVAVAKLEQLTPGERYTSLVSWDAGWLDIFNQKDKLKKRFKESMSKLYGQFDQLSPIQDLQALLGEPANLPIHYPRPNCEPSSEENNYEWFMGNKKRKKPLPLPPNDTEGYPIWDKRGKETT